MHDGGRKSSKYLLWFLAEQEPLVKLGLAEAAADGAHGAVVRGAVIEPPELEELSLPGHVLRESFKTGPENNIDLVLGGMRNDNSNQSEIRVASNWLGKESYLIKALDSSLPSVWSERQ